MEIKCFLCHKNCTIRAMDLDRIIGAECKKGIEFATTELKEPKRVLTATVKTVFKDIPVISVKTDGAILKSDVFKAMKVLKIVIVNEFLNVGDVVVENIAGSGVNVVSTINMRRFKK